jgi:hypothetical protein
MVGAPPKSERDMRDNGPLAWVIESKDRPPFVFRRYATEQEAMAVWKAMCEEDGDDPQFVVVPLYRSPALTDAEREAITVACGDSSQWGRPHVATLMRLLERTK